MDIQTSKIELAKIILSIENTEFLEKIKNFISKEKKDFWDDLTLSEKAEIELGIKQLHNGERISYDDFLKKISQMSVLLSPQAQFKLEQLNDYLLENWNSKVRDEFI